MPFSLTLSNMLKFALQFMLFLIVWFYFVYSGSVTPNIYALLLPINIAMIAMMGLGTGLILSSLSIRFRDINFIVGFFLQLAMYVSSVIIPVSMAGKYKWIILANPMSSIIESFKYGFLGAGYFNPMSLVYSYVCAILLFLFGIMSFKKAEGTFIDKI
jgi:lipopolysaccharide transport system permease protein